MCGKSAEPGCGIAAADENRSDNSGKEVNVTQQEMMLLVPKKLKEIEKEHGIRVLYAAESGSRAWGTASEQSDFDIRFLYIRPMEAYLRLEQPRDVLEFPISESWDMCGWDLAKALRLLRNANTQIYEWLGSPVVYTGTDFPERFRPLLEACFSVRTAANHDLHQAELKMRKLQKAETPKVKHYLYALQYLAAAEWVLQYRRSAPVAFAEVLSMLPEEIREKGLVLRRKKTEQQVLMPRDERLEAWLWEESARIRERIGLLPEEGRKDWAALDSFFLSELAEK